MYIHEAVKRALEIDGVIYRKSEREPIGEYERSCFTMINHQMDTNAAEL